MTCQTQRPQGDSTYVKCPEKATYRDRKSISAPWGGGRRGEDEVSLWANKNIPESDSDDI